MEELLPKWIMKRYLILQYEAKKQNLKQFDFQFAENALKTSLGDTKRVVGLSLSELRKAGWLEADFAPDDRRMRVYKLRDYHFVFNQYLEEILKNKK